MYGGDDVLCRHALDEQAMLLYSRQRLHLQGTSASRGCERSAAQGREHASSAYEIVCCNEGPSFPFGWCFRRPALAGWQPALRALGCESAAHAVPTCSPPPAPSMQPSTHSRMFCRGGAAGRCAALWPPRCPDAPHSPLARALTFIPSANATASGSRPEDCGCFLWAHDPKVARPLLISFWGA